MGNGPYDLLKGIYRPLLERFETAARDPERAQRERLAALLARDAQTDYGRRCGFASIRTAEEFRARVPAVDFDDLAPEVERIANGARDVLAHDEVVRFVKTSGTTGPAKRIPVTASLAREVRDAQLVWLVHMLKENPKHADGTKLTLVSPEDEERTPAGIPVGANTGRMQRALPWFVRFGSRPHPDVLAVKDAALRGYLVALSAAGSDVGIVTTANASTVWQLARRLREWSDSIAEALDRGGVPEALPDGTPVPEALRRGLARRFKRRRAQARRLRAAASSSAPLFPALWPRLTTVNCWRGGPAAFWLEKLGSELGGIPVRDPGFSASEGFFAVPLESGTAAGVLLAHGPFFEFEPLEGGDPVGVEGLVEGREYEIRITTCGGLWRYAMRDVIRVVGRHARAPLVEFVRKAGSILSITGEKVTEPHVLAAAAAAARATGTRIAAAGATLETGEPPRYVALVEPEGPAPDPAAFARAFDEALRAANVEYAGKRADGRLGAASARVVPGGSWDALRRAQLAAGAPEAQVKVPVLFPPGTLPASLRAVG